MLRVGIVGLGVISEIHIDAVMRLHNLADLVAVCDCLPEKQKCVPEVSFYTDLETMLKRRNLIAYIYASPIIFMDGRPA